MSNGSLQDGVDGIPDTDIAQITVTVVVPVVHCLLTSLAEAADSSDIVAMFKSCIDKSPSHQTSRAEYDPYFRLNVV